MRILLAPISSSAYRQPFIVINSENQISLTSFLLILGRPKFLNRLRGTIRYSVQTDQIPYWVLDRQKEENEPSTFCPDSQIRPDSLWGFEARTQTCEEPEQYEQRCRMLQLKPKLHVPLLKLKQTCRKYLVLESVELLE